MDKHCSDLSYFVKENFLTEGKKSFDQEKKKCNTLFKKHLMECFSYSFPTTFH